METVINNHFDWGKSSISLEDIEAAMGKVRATGGPVGLGNKPIVYGDINPCSEIFIPMDKSPKIELIKERDSVLSTESGNKVVTQNSYIDSLDVDFDEAVWRIYMPGVPKEDIQVFTVKDKVYVDVTNGAPRKTFKLAEGESVKSTKLELGVLTITIDRPDKRESIEVQ